MEHQFLSNLQKVNSRESQFRKNERRETLIVSKGGSEPTNQAEHKSSLKLPKLAKKKLNEKAKILIRLIEEKRKKSLDLATYLLKTIDVAFNALISHFSRHIETLTSLIVKETLSQDELDSALKILSKNYLPDEDLRKQCKI